MGLITTGGRLAQSLHAQGYFRVAQRWRRMSDLGIYSIDDHRRFVASHKCCLVGMINDHGCEGRQMVVVHLPEKSPWFHLPVCDEALFGDALARNPAKCLSSAVGLVSQGMARAMANHLGLNSLTELTPQLLAKFNQEIGFD